MISANSSTRAAAASLALFLAGCAGVPFGDNSPASGNTGRRAEDVLTPRAQRPARPGHPQRRRPARRHQTL